MKSKLLVLVILSFCSFVFAKTKPEIHQAPLTALFSFVYFRPNAWIIKTFALYLHRKNERKGTI